MYNLERVNGDLLAQGEVFMSELTEEELGDIALRVTIAFTPHVTGEGDAEREAALLAFGVHYVVKETGVTSEKAMQFLRRLDGLASDLNEKEAEGIALSFLRKRFPRYLKIQNVDRFSQLTAERTGIPSGLLAMFTQQLLAQ